MSAAPCEATPSPITTATYAAQIAETCACGHPRNNHRPIGTAYAVWVGIGAVGTALFGMLFLGEPRALPRIGSVALIVAGVVGLRLAEGQ